MNSAGEWGGHVRTTEHEARHQSGFGRGIGNGDRWTRGGRLGEEDGCGRP